MAKKTAIESHNVNKKTKGDRFNHFSLIKPKYEIINIVEGDRDALDVTLILYSGKEIPLKISLLR